MFLSSFLAGLISIVSPSVLLMTFLLVVSLSKLTLSNKNTTIQILIICLSIISVFLILSLLLIGLTPTILNDYSSNIMIKWIIFFVYIIYGFWLSGIENHILSKNSNNKTFENFMFLIIPIAFSLSVFSNSLLIVSSILLSNHDSDNILPVITPMISFSIGLVIPVGLILFSLRKLIKRLSENKIWKKVQLLSGIILVIMAVIGVFEK